MRIILHPLAEADLSEAVSFYEDRALGLGQDFILDFERTLTRISEDPGIGARMVRECGESSSADSHSAFSIAQPVRTSVSSR